jgi:hypothetical protein
MWADVPTDDRLADLERGKRFAEVTISAMIADQCKHGRALHLIFEAIIDDAVRRRVKGGNGSRKLQAAVYGYLEVLTNFVAGKCLRSGPSAA